MKDIVFFCYPKCSTCQKAKKWLEENSVEFIERDIVKNNPTEAELKKFYKKSKKELKKFFNTSGILYREMELKDRRRNAKIISNRWKTCKKTYDSYKRFCFKWL